MRESTGRRDRQFGISWAQPDWRGLTWFCLGWRLGFAWFSLDSLVRNGTFQRVTDAQRRQCNSQAGLLLPGPKAVRGEAAPLGRKEAVPSRTEGIPSWAEGNPSQSEGNPNRAEGNPSLAEGNPNVYPFAKSRYFNGLRSTQAGGLRREVFSQSLPPI